MLSTGLDDTLTRTPPELWRDCSCTFIDVGLNTGAPFIGKRGNGSLVMDWPERVRLALRKAYAASGDMPVTHSVSAALRGAGSHSHPHAQ